MFISSPCTPQQHASHTGTLSDDNRFAFMLPNFFVLSAESCELCAFFKKNMLPAKEKKAPRINPTFPQFFLKKICYLRKKKKRQESTRHFLSFF